MNARCPPKAEETTGLAARLTGGTNRCSGQPLMQLATRVLRDFAALLKNEIPLIGGGGVMSAADALAKFEAGASLVQIYSGLVFRGPRLISECVSAYRQLSQTELPVTTHA